MQWMGLCAALPFALGVAFIEQGDDHIGVADAFFGAGDAETSVLVRGHFDGQQLFA